MIAGKLDFSDLLGRGVEAKGFFKEEDHDMILHCLKKQIELVKRAKQKSDPTFNEDDWMFDIYFLAYPKGHSVKLKVDEESL